MALSSVPGAFAGVVLLALELGGGSSLAACGPSGSGGSTTAGASTSSTSGSGGTDLVANCHLQASCKNAGSCTDYGNFASASQKQATSDTCMANGGTFSSSACARKDYGGGCFFSPAPNDVCHTTWVKDSVDLPIADAKSGCLMAAGIWLEP